MDGVDRGGRWKSLKERLGLKGMGCCGASWGLNPTTISVRDDDEEEDNSQQQQQIGTIDVGQTPPAENISDLDCVGQTPPAENISDPDCVGQIPAAATSMNLATALAAERQFRSAQESDGGEVVGSPRATSIGTEPATPSRVSLMRLLSESDGVDGETEEKVGENDLVCCVCMGRKKGAAFIPCGHTFCRVCSREMWLNRGSCPLCNRSILEILDIF